MVLVRIWMMMMMMMKGLLAPALGVLRVLWMMKDVLEILGSAS